MTRFNYDYSEDVHEHILSKLMETNLEQTPGYGEDLCCEEAAAVTRELCQKEDTSAHFLAGGIQADATVIVSASRPHQGVAEVVTTHINVCETGVVEVTGHKILSLPSADGKIIVSQMEELYLAHINGENFEHMIQPGVVYMSNPAEPGTIYTRTKLEAPHRAYGIWGLYLFAGDARLAYELTAEDNDVDLKVLASNCDVLYTGGTKAGALFGEAMTTTNEEPRRDLHYHIKQRDGMLAKGKLLRIQFEELLRDGLHMELGRHGDGMTDKIRKTCQDKEIPLLVTNTTNQIFSIIPDALLEQWKDKYNYTNQGRMDEAYTVIWFCASWVTSEEHVDVLVKDILNS